MAQLNFDATQISPEQGNLGAVPTGWYNAMIKESEVKPNKAQTGYYLALQFEIMDGTYAGRKVFTNININNPNPTAQRIGLGQLSAIAHAVGVMYVEDSQQLHGRPLKIRAVYQPANDQYGEGNNIVAFQNINYHTGEPAAAPTAVMPAQMQQAPAQLHAVQAPSNVQTPEWLGAAQQAPQPWAQTQMQAPQMAPQQAQAPQNVSPAATVAPQQFAQQAPQQQAQAQPAPVQQQAPQQMQTGGDLPAWANQQAQPVQQQAQPVQPAQVQAGNPAADDLPPWLKNQQ